MRVAIAGINHESSTFANSQTTLANFQNDHGVYQGQAIIEYFSGTNVCTGGFVDVAEQQEIELVPLLRAQAHAGGVIDRGDYESLKGDIVARLKEALERPEQLDGVLLDQHGAMVIEGIDDGDGDLIQAVRELVGELPVVVTTDLHANQTLKRVAAADAIVGFDTYPHVDMAERGREAASIIAQTIRGELKPVMAIHQIPLLWGCPCQITPEPPMDEVIRRLHALEERPGIITATVSTGFPWADVPEVGASVIVVADDDSSLAQAAADELAEWIWDNRRSWYSEPLSVRDALRQGESLGKYPIILADHADNPGGGSPGDSTEILRTFLELQLDDALLLQMLDPEVAKQACDAGVGARLRLAVGGKSDPIQGPPVEGEFEVVATTPGEFRYDGPMFAGLDGNMGPSAWLRTGGVSVVVVSGRDQPFDTAFARTLGIDCAKMKYISIKSAVHFRAAFGPIAGSIFSVDAAALQTHDFKKLPYENHTRELFPIELS